MAPVGFFIVFCLVFYSTFVIHLVLFDNGGGVYVSGLGPDCQGWVLDFFFAFLYH